jgi:hypothetical protein
MFTRSSNNWKTKSGGWDSLHTELIDFNTDYPILSSNIQVTDFNLVMCNNYKNINDNSLISMFVDDYILERYWNNPLKYTTYYNYAKYVMSPDFSLLIGMPKPMQQWNVYRNRFVGYVWKKSGINVISTISWSDESSFDYCFKGVELNSTIAVSNIGCRNYVQKQYFDLGLKKMQETLQPKIVIFQCNKKFRNDYKDNNFIFIDSFWDNKRKLNSL